jgi:hypothetical protein
MGGRWEVPLKPTGASVGRRQAFIMGKSRRLGSSVDQKQSSEKPSVLLTCRLRNLCIDGTPSNLKNLQSHSLAQKHGQLPHSAIIGQFRHGSATISMDESSFRIAVLNSTWESEEFDVAMLFNCQRDSVVALDPIEGRGIHMRYLYIYKYEIFYRETFVRTMALSLFL